MTSASLDKVAPFDHHRGARPLLRETSTLRGVFFVGTNVLAFVAVNAFLYYLSSGRWFDSSWDSAVTGFRRSLATPLLEMLVRPVSIFAHPWMIVVTGLVVAAVAFVPVMMAVLYRLWVSLVFVLAVAVVGHAPLLAVFVLTGCLLVGHTPLRSNQPFLSLLAGFLPVVLYMYFFSYGLERTLMPLQRPVLYLPFILALVAAVSAGAVVFWLARLTQYRPGVIWPVLVVSLVVPVWLFWQMVGPAELEYCLIARSVEASDSLFRPMTLDEYRRQGGQWPAKMQPSQRRSATESAPATAAGSIVAMATIATSAATTSAVVAATAPAPPVSTERADALYEAVSLDLDCRRKDLLEQCDQFVRRHPGSPRLAAVLWIAACAIDVQVDRQALAERRVKYVYAGPSTASQGAWDDLLKRCGGAPQAMVGQFRLGVQALRDERAGKAAEHLHLAQTMLLRYLEGYTPSAAQIFVKDEALPGVTYYQAALADVSKVLWLMEENNVADKTDAGRAFAEYMRLWPFAGAAAAKLEGLAVAHEKTPVADDFRIQAALAVSDPRERGLRLARVAAQARGINPHAAIAANYELGRLALRMEQSPAWAGEPFRPAHEYFEAVLTATDNPYRRPSQSHLEWLARNRIRQATTASRPEKKG